MAPRADRAARSERWIRAAFGRREMLLACAVLFAIGCQKQDPQPAPAPAAASAPAPAAAVEIGAEPLKTGIGAADQALAEKVKGRIATDPRFHGATIDVDAQGGRVTLWGHLPSADLKSAAGQLAHQTPGVSSIANLIAVEPAASGPSSGR